MVSVNTNTCLDSFDSENSVLKKCLLNTNSSTLKRNKLIVDLYSITKEFKKICWLKTIKFLVFLSNSKTMPKRGLTILDHIGMAHYTEAVLYYIPPSVSQ